MNRERLLRELSGQIRDERVLAAIAAVPRDLFVPPPERRRAWENRALGIGRGQTISQPTVVARMCQALDVQPGHRVLDVGTGSGYHAAVLATLGARVWSIERHRPLSEQAARNLEAAGIEGVELLVGDGRQGHPEEAPYDGISVAATAEGGVPGVLVEQLGSDGRLVAPVRDADGERLVLIRRRPDGGLERADLEAVRFVPLLDGIEE
jgi:protein-L-isoaspartate(D-aspartate) O-methyltransferase